MLILTGQLLQKATMQDSILKEDPQKEMNGQRLEMFPETEHQLSSMITLSLTEMF